MSVEENKQIVRRLEEETRNRNNAAVIDELVGPDGWLEHGLSEDKQRSLSDLKASVAQMRAEIPDLSIEIGDLFGEGDRVAVRWVIRGTAKGDLETPWGRFASAGKKLAFPGTTIYRVVNGRVTEAWSVGDLGALMEQLGAKITLPGADS